MPFFLGRSAIFDFWLFGVGMMDGWTDVSMFNFRFFISISMKIIFSRCSCCSCWGNGINIDIGWMYLTMRENESLNLHSFVPSIGVYFTHFWSWQLSLPLKIYTPCSKRETEALPLPSIKKRFHNKIIYVNIQFHKMIFSNFFLLSFNSEQQQMNTLSQISNKLKIMKIVKWYIFY